MRRLLPALVAAPLLAGCGLGGPPEVTFGVAGTETTAGPARYCDIALTTCDDDATAVVRIDVPPNTPLRVAVPGEVAQTPWHVVFRYRSAAGEQVDGRSPVFAPGARGEYVLELPAPTDVLLTAQVQQFGPPPQATAAGEVEFPVRASWVLTTPTLDAAPNTAPNF
ncbi:MAG: DUF2771 family protein [Pseudonocardia sp.]